MELYRVFLKIYLCCFLYIYARVDCIWKLKLMCIWNAVWLKDRQNMELYRVYLKIYLCFFCFVFFAGFYGNILWF